MRKAIVAPLCRPVNIIRKVALPYMMTVKGIVVFAVDWIVIEVVSDKGTPLTNPEEIFI
jgi:hypothetical protein